MGRPSYIAGNVAENAGLSASSEDAAYPLANLVDGQYDLPFRFTSGGSSWFELDLLAAREFNGLLIGNHNLVSTATITVKAGASPNPSTVVATPSWRGKNIMATFADQNVRYIRVEIVDAQPAGTVTQIGLAVPGQRVVLPRGVRFGVEPHVRQENIADRTNRGRRYALRLFEIEERGYVFRFPRSELAQFKTWWDAVRGGLDPFVWMEDDDGTEALYVSIEGDGFRPAELPEQAPDAVMEWAVRLVEEGTGAEILA